MAMEFFDTFSELLKNNFWVRTAYATFCGAMVLFIGCWLHNRGQKNGFSDNESMMS